MSNCWTFLHRKMCKLRHIYLSLKAKLCKINPIFGHVADSFVQGCVPHQTKARSTDGLICFIFQGSLRGLNFDIQNK